MARIVFPPRPAVNDGNIGQDGMDSTFIPPEALAAHFGRRFLRFQGECGEHLERIEEHRSAFRAHHAQLRDAESLRQQVCKLQRRLTEVEVQATRERVRALRIDAEHKDLDLRRKEHADEVQRLLAAQASPTAALVSSHTQPVPSGSLSSVRLVSTPNADQLVTEAVATPAELWQQIEQEVASLGEDLDGFDQHRAQRAVEHEQAVLHARAELQLVLEELESDREHLADSLVGYVQLCARHLERQRMHAQDVEAMKTCNRELEIRAEELEKIDRTRLQEVRSLACREAGEHIAYRRDAEIVERDVVATAQACLQDVREEGETRASSLAGEIRLLKEKCAEHRRRRRLALDGLRADLSLVGKKLDVLEDVAEQVSERLARASSETRGADGGRQSQPRQGTSPYAKQRSGTSRRRRPQSRAGGRGGVRSTSQRPESAMYGWVASG
mmetsp:Transcript_28899/g.52822  ORF Transcript_28899/g.52822 Transcript_28899/m.52822 type:complete len:443 (+) Transcript_28899:89-1417(+)